MMGSRDLLVKFWDALHISRTVEARNFKFGRQIGQNLVNVTLSRVT